jgi:hypothetical protein
MGFKINVKTDAEAQEELNEMLGKWRDDCRKGT